MIFLFSHPLFYSLSLVAFSLVTMYYLLLVSTTTGLAALIILIIYIGAMMILFGYVCAVVPNVNYATTVSLTTFVGFLIFFHLVLSFSVNSLPATFNDFNLSSFFYSYYGLSFFILIIVLMLLLLYIVSTTTQVNSPFRSLWECNIN